MTRAYGVQAQAQVAPTSEDIAWAAGFLEGEGSFTARAGRDWRARVSAWQKQYEPLSLLLLRFGGAIYTDHKRGLHQWVLRGQPAKDLMQVLRPRMTSWRQAQIDLALRMDVSVAFGTPEFVEQRRRARLGKRNSPEMNKKISESVTRWHAERKQYK